MMPHVRKCMLCVLVVLSNGFAQMLGPQDVLTQLFVEPLREEQFSSAFLDAVPVGQLETILSQIEDELGAFEQVEGDANPYTIVFTEGTARAQISLSDGVITGLFFDQLEPLNVDLAETLKTLTDLPGEVAVIINTYQADDIEVLTQVKADTPLAVGSAFKLLVLNVLQEQILNGEHTWDEVVYLRESWRSLPSGVIQDWPVGTAVTLETLATLMISISDNTATDALIDILGRDALEARTARNKPFLTTGEAFSLKLNADALARYRNADTADKYDILTELAPPDLAGFTGEPMALDIEWFFSIRDLCEQMRTVKDLELMRINPGLANANRWQKVAYKGGSEPGVLAFVTWLEAASGEAYCVAVAQNNPDAALDEAVLSRLYRNLLAYVATLP
ncbi:MAG: serine hydrolase [Deinococcota bacterium]